MNLIHEFITRARQTAILWCQNVNLLSTNRECHRCHGDMLLCDTSRKTEGRNVCVGLQFRCRKPRYVGRIRPHDVTHTISDGTWFARSNLPMEFILQLTYCMAHQMSYAEIRREVHSNNAQLLSDETLADWYSYFREVVARCIDERFALAGPIGGPGHIVEIDETKIGHRKYHRGRVVDGHWLIGMVDRGTSELRVEICPQNLRDAATLLPIIQRNVLPGTRIITDEWRAYRTLPTIGYQHDSVNHSLHFVDPNDPTVNTQKIESSWHALKSIGGFRNGGRR